MPIDPKALEYVQMLVEGNASVFWHLLPRENPDPARVPDLVKDAIYRAVAQALRDTCGMPLPPNRQQFTNVLRAARQKPTLIEGTTTDG